MTMSLAEATAAGSVCLRVNRPAFLFLVLDPVAAGLGQIP
jgi:hypothetical protein